MPAIPRCSWAETNPGFCLNVSAVFVTSCRNSSISCGISLKLVHLDDWSHIFIQLFFKSYSFICFYDFYLTKFMVFSISVFVDRKIREHQSDSRLIILTTILIILTDNLDNPSREIILTLFVSQNDIICSIPIERSYESDNNVLRPNILQWL